MLGVVGFLADQQSPAGSFAMRDDQAGVDVGAVTEHGDALALLRQTGAAPHMGVGFVARGGAGRAVATTRRVSASMMTCTFAENR